MSSFMPTVMSSKRETGVDRQIDRMLDEALRTFNTSDERWVPACNVRDDDNGFYVQVALPGWEASHITLEVNNQMLTIKGERKEEAADVSRYHLREFGGSRFVRIFKLPSVVDHDKASATHKDGLLTIAFPKREEAKCRRILIAAE
jgi:HSP20 family protein